eukprot:TRINITY_DN6345_c0_g1_i1.p2 TRINITY_DN6345_c0_g1~~TRINITY_DN6345_c0_g1_i1.p2  ORF type:complete len:143 (+),score=36.97 TRINITY_DN6345_c0_g1_i1:56-430(+)
MHASEYGGRGMVPPLNFRGAAQQPQYRPAPEVHPQRRQGMGLHPFSDDEADDDEYGSDGTDAAGQSAEWLLLGLRRSWWRDWAVRPCIGAAAAAIGWASGNAAYVALQELAGAWRAWVMSERSR